MVQEDDDSNRRTTITINDESNDIDESLSHKLDKLYLNEDPADRRSEISSTRNVDDNIYDSNPNDFPATETNIRAKNLINAGSINDIETDAGSIIDYADEPLLPLVKACTPLIDIVHDISLYAQRSLKETPEEPPDGLTIDESAAIRLYTMEWEGSHRSLYSMLNHTLKKGTREELRPYHKYLKLLLTALVKLPCEEPLAVWRGVTKDMSADFPPGTPVTWWSFTSCTHSLPVLENNIYLGTAGARTLFSVEAINGRVVRNHSSFATEDEILLLPGTHMIVQSQFSPAPDLHVIHLKQKRPDEVLLELPFEGIILGYSF